ncbi:MAG: PEGA domain-containing protein [Planctomycetota bacterium]
MPSNSHQFKPTALACVAAMVVLSGCSSTTVINTRPQGARIYVEGQLIGTSPVEYTDSAITGSKREVRIELDRYETITGSFSRNGKVNADAIVGGIFLLVPYLWAMDYEDEYTFVLTPER